MIAASYNRRSIIDIGPLAISIFLLGGVASSSLVAAGAALLSVVSAAIIVTRTRIPRAAWWLLLYFALAILPIISTTYTPYAKEKIAKLYTIMLIAAIGPVFTIRRTDHLERLFTYIAVIGMSLAVIGLFSVVVGGSVVGRLSTYGAHPIWFGRACGFAAIWLYILAIDNHRWRPLYTLGTALCIAAMVGSGSKGPILFYLISIASITIPFYLTRRTFWRGIAFFAIVAIATSIFIVPLFSASIDRLTYFLISAGTSETSRIESYRLAIASIGDNMSGIGYGGFEAFGSLQYPHNIVLEAFVEGGWLFGTYLLILLALGLVRALRFSRYGDPAYRALLPMMLFALLNSMVSGDITSPKDLFVFISIALTLNSYTEHPISSKWS